MDPQLTTTNASLEMTLAIVHNNPLLGFFRNWSWSPFTGCGCWLKEHNFYVNFFLPEEIWLGSTPRSNFMWFGFQPPSSEPNGIRWQAQEVIGDIIRLEASWDLQAHPLKCLLSVFDQLRLMRVEREPLISTGKGSKDSSKADWARELEINYRSAVV